jgi:hypothetical protein
VLGVQVSTVHQTYAQKPISPAPRSSTYQTQDEANQDLVAGRIDATQADSLALADFLATDAGKACCELKGAVADDPAMLGLGVGVGLRKGEDALKARFNAASPKILADGTYDEISAGYFRHVDLRQLRPGRVRRPDLDSFPTLALLAPEPPGWGGNLLRGLVNSLQIALGAFGLGLVIGTAGPWQALRRAGAARPAGHLYHRRAGGAGTGADPDPVLRADRCGEPIAGRPGAGRAS